MPPLRPARPETGPESGFAYLVMASLVLAFGTALILSRSVGSAAEATTRRALTSEAALAQAEAALLRFAQSQARLPCPADGTQPLADAGIEAPRREGRCDLGAGRTPTDGALPWATLGLPASAALDGWGQRLRYMPTAAGASADRSFVLDRALLEAPAGSGGLTVALHGADGRTQASYQAAFVLWSSGPNGRDALTEAGTRRAGPDDRESASASDLRDEDENADGDTSFVARAAPAAAATLDQPAAFDDRMRWLTLEHVRRAASLLPPES